MSLEGTLSEGSQAQRVSPSTGSVQSRPMHRDRVREWSLGAAEAGVSDVGSGVFQGMMEMPWN